PSRPTRPLGWLGHPHQPRLRSRPARQRNLRSVDLRADQPDCISFSPEQTFPSLTQKILSKNEATSSKEPENTPLVRSVRGILVSSIRVHPRSSAVRLG